MKYLYKQVGTGQTVEFDFPMGTAPERVVVDFDLIFNRVYTAPGIQFKGKGFYSTGG